MKMVDWIKRTLHLGPDIDTLEAAQERAQETKQVVKDVREMRAEVHQLLREVRPTRNAIANSLGGRVGDS